MQRVATGGGEIRQERSKRVDLGLGDHFAAIAIQHAALDIKPLNALIPRRPLYSFRIIGADMSLVRTSDGRFELSGLGVSGRNSGTSDNSQLRMLTTVGEVRLEDSSLSFDDAERDIHVQLTGMQGRLQLDGTELSTELEADISDEYKDQIQAFGDKNKIANVALTTTGDADRFRVSEDAGSLGP